MGGGKLKLIALAFWLGFAWPSYAERRVGGNFVALDVGAYGLHLDERYSVSPDSRSQIGQVGGFLRVRRGFHLGRNFYFEPGLGVLIPWRTNPDTGAITLTNQVDLAVTIPLWSFLGVRAGPGFQMMTTLSSAKPVVLNNGVSTSTFYSPGGVSAALYFTVQGGLAIHFSRRVSLLIDVYVPEIASRLRRRWDAALTLGIVL